MYAIIRTGGKQSKVRAGDVIDVERLRADGEVTFTPLLVVDDSGTVFSKRDDLKDAKVVARVVGAGSGPKVEIFKYKAKTGYRRRQGHRQKYTTIEVVDIVAPGKKPSAEAEKPAAKAAKPAAEAAKPAAKAEKPSAKAEKPAAKAAKPAAEKAASKDEAPIEEVDAAAEVAKRLAAPKGAEADDLKALTGVGKVLEGKLNDLGIITFAQLANLSDADAALLTEAVGGSIDRVTGWADQAKQLLDEKES